MINQQPERKKWPSVDASDQTLPYLSTLTLCLKEFIHLKDIRKKIIKLYKPLLYEKLTKERAIQREKINYLWFYLHNIYRERLIPCINQEVELIRADEEELKPSKIKLRKTIGVHFHYFGEICCVHDQYWFRETPEHEVDYY